MIVINGFRLMIMAMFLIVGLGCAFHRPIMPQMDLPPVPHKPTIKSSVIVQNNIPWVAYSMNDSLRLYEYLLHKDVYERELRNRIESMNKIMGK